MAPVGASGCISLAPHGPLNTPSGQTCHVYISYAGEASCSLADFLKEELNHSYPALEVFADTLPMLTTSGQMHSALSDAFVGE
jgi:hypothetical protein